MTEPECSWCHGTGQMYPWSESRINCPQCLDGKSPPYRPALKTPVSDEPKEK